MKASIAILASVVILLFVTPAMAQDMPALTYDFSWTVNSTYSPQGGGNNTTVHTTGSGPLTYVANPGAGTGGAGTVTMSFGTPTNGGTFSFVQVGTAPGPHADDTFSFTTGPEGPNPPPPRALRAFPRAPGCPGARCRAPSK